MEPIKSPVIFSIRKKAAELANLHPAAQYVPNSAIPNSDKNYFHCQWVTGSVIYANTAYPRLPISGNLVGQAIFAVDKDLFRDLTNFSFRYKSNQFYEAMECVFGYPSPLCRNWQATFPVGQRWGMLDLVWLMILDTYTKRGVPWLKATGLTRHTHYEWIKLAGQSYSWSGKQVADNAKVEVENEEPTELDIQSPMECADPVG